MSTLTAETASMSNDSWYGEDDGMNDNMEDDMDDVMYYYDHNNMVFQLQTVKIPCKALIGHLHHR